MPEIRLICWDEDAAHAHLERLEKAGYQAVYDEVNGLQALKLLRAEPPDAIVIDLDRMPSHGRETARAVRTTKALRHLPIVFAGGAPEKLGPIQALLPDATFTSWRAIKGALRRAMAGAPAEPVVPQPYMAGYSGTPLAKKLGIAEGVLVALVGAPRGFDLGPLPPGVSVSRVARGTPDVALFFATERRALEKRIAGLDALAGRRRLWLCWPKKTSGVRSDLSEPVVRAIGLARGLVDYKIAAIDDTWSGLLFTRRKR